MTKAILSDNIFATSYSGTLDLLTQDYPSKSIDQNQSQLVNMYLTKDISKGKYDIIAYSLPGLETFCDTGQANVRTMYEQNDILYVIAGNKFYSINSAGIKTELGTLNTSSGFAKISTITGGTDLNNQIVIIDGTNGYHYNIGTAVATFPIADVDFPQTAVDICSQDDYFIVLANNSMNFYISEIANGLSWNALDFGGKTGAPDKIKAIVSNQRRLYVMGTKTIEPYADTGDALFPFERVDGAFIHYGVAAKNSVVSCEEYILFLGKTADGGYRIMQLKGYDISVIGNEVLSTIIASMTTKTDAVAYCYQKDGHTFYELTFPTDNRTITLDVTTQASFNRQSYNGSSYSRFIGNCSAFCYDKTLIGAYNSGIIYNQSTSIYVDGIQPLRRMFVSPPIYFGNRRITISKLLIDVETNIGTNKTILLEKSRNSGRTWATVATYTVGTEPNTRLFSTCLGSSRNWMFRVTSSMNANFTLLGFQVEASLGNN